jgi:hypothetical protein
VRSEGERNKSYQKALEKKGTTITSQKIVGVAATLAPKYLSVCGWHGFTPYLMGHWPFL